MSTDTDSPPGDSTRDRLIEAGLRVFGEHGFNGTSTRKLAREAGVNLAAIPYHFGGKEGLYLAVAAHIAERIGAHVLPIVDEVEDCFRQGADRRRVVALLHKLVRKFAQLIICTAEADSWSAVILREQTNPTAAFDVLYRHFMQHVSQAINRLVGAILDKPADDPETILQSTTLIGQIMIFRTSRATVLRRLGWDSYDANSAGPVLDVILRNVDACLGITAAEAS